MTITEEQRGTVAFDLEAARAICEAATKADFIFQDEQLDGDEDSWGGEYYKTGEIFIIQDDGDAPESIGQLDRQEDAEFFCQAIKLFPDALAEIERLRARESGLEQRLEWIIRDGFKKQEEQVAKIKELEAQCEDLMQNCNSLRERAWKAEARIKEQDGALVEERANKMIQADDCTQNEDAADFHHRCICEYNVKKCPVEKWWLDRARITLQAEGKIGPDAAKPQSWQITEERKAAIDRGLQFLEWSYAKNSAHDTKEQIAVLWAMLDEVGQ